MLACSGGYGLIYDKEIEKCLKNGGDTEVFNVE